MIALILLILFVIWNVYLPFYHERIHNHLKRDESNLISEKARSIEIRKGNSKAVLFIHGYPSSPDMYSYPAKVFSESGYDAFAPLIPTFASDIKAFEKTNFSEWFEYIDSYYLSLKGEYEKVYVAGVSMGGAMTLKLAERHPEIPAIAVLAAPVTYNSLIKDGIVTDWRTYFARTIALFVKNINGSAVLSHPDSNDGDENWIGYGGVFPRQGLSLIFNLKAIRRDLGKVKCPAILIHDKGDKTVPFGNQRIIRSSISSKKVKVLSPRMDVKYKHSHHSLLMYESVRKEYTDDILSFFMEATDDKA